jgi:hypothetical protein
LSQKTGRAVNGLGKDQNPAAQFLSRLIIFIVDNFRRQQSPCLRDGAEFTGRLGHATNLYGRGGHRGVTERHQNQNVKILAAIAVIWGLSFLSLGYSLVPDSTPSDDADDGTAEKPEIAA